MLSALSVTRISKWNMENDIQRYMMGLGTARNRRIELLYRHYYGHVLAKQSSAAIRRANRWQGAKQ
eukprot:scaffold347319_cov45-Prasinocladus_malaysianus.AAC.1